MLKREHIDMRRFLGPVLVGLGVFLVIGGLLLRFYAYPRLAVAPIDQNSVTKLEATGANIFDTTALKPLTTDLAVQNKTVGDVKASEEQGDNVRVWVGSTSIRSSDGTVRSRSTERTAFDATSAEAVNCCGNFEESTDGQRDPVKREGLVFKFPFATEKKTYQVWDDSVGSATPATFVKETKIDGLTVYEFQQTIDRVKVGTRQVPASLVGGTGTGNVEGDNMYALDKQIFVEPVTGAIIDQHQHTTSTVGHRRRGQADRDRRAAGLHQGHRGFERQGLLVQVEPAQPRARAVATADGGHRPGRDRVRRAVVPQAPRGPRTSDRVNPGRTASPMTAPIVAKLRSFHRRRIRVPVERARAGARRGQRRQAVVAG